MKKTIFLLAVVVVAVLLFSSMMSMKSSVQSGANPEPKLVLLDNASPTGCTILGGPPATVTMHSGYMVLGPGKSVGQHSTKNNEETVVVMAGKGEFSIIGGKTLQIRAFCEVYCPPGTEHNVTNTGADTLRYVYTVAKAR